MGYLCNSERITFGLSGKRYMSTVSKNEEEESTTGLLDTPLVMDLEADNSDGL